MSDNQLAVYEDAAIRHNAAYAAFRSIYETKNPPPIMPEFARDTASMLIIIALVIVTIASVIVSGTRTVAEFGNYGLVAFVMVEGGMMVYAFFRARRGAGTERVDNSRRLALAGLILAFVTAIFANVDNVLTSDGINLPEVVNTIIALLVGLSAPVMTFINSDVLALELMAGDARRRQVHEAYRSAHKEWVDGLNRSWASQQTRWGVKVEVEDATRNATQRNATQPVERVATPLLTEGNKIRNGDGVIVGHVCPGCGKELSKSGWSRHKKTCSQLIEMVEVRNDSKGDVR